MLFGHKTKRMMTPPPTSFRVCFQQSACPVTLLLAVSAFREKKKKNEINNETNTNDNDNYEKKIIRKGYCYY